MIAEVPVRGIFQDDEVVAVGQVNQALAQMRAFMVEFGLTPSARVRVATEAPRELSEFEQYLARKNRQADQAEERAA